MDNIRKKITLLILLVGNSVFMLMTGPVRLSDDLYDSILSIFGNFLGSFVLKLAAGSLIIISYAILLFIALKMFPKEVEK